MKKQPRRTDANRPAPMRVTVELNGNVVVSCGNQSFCAYHEWKDRQGALYFAKYVKRAIKRARAWERGER